jgi:CRISPR-associated endonuclease/helicase Cas3
MPKGTYHLSALMCAEHRSDILSEIKERLKKNESVRVISTQLVEAGVDIDFPVVYRALAGIDSIVQAAGRCNREGKLNIEGKRGRVVVFNAPRKAPVGMLRKASESAEGIIKSGVKNLEDRDVYTRYFSDLYWKASGFDKKDMVKLLKPQFSKPTCETQIGFKTASDSFKIIDDSMQRSILVPYKEGEKLIKFLQTVKGSERVFLRKLQRYSVTIYTDQFFILYKRGSLVEVLPGIFVLNNNVEYDDKIGLLIDEMPNDPEAFMF